MLWNVIGVALLGVFLAKGGNDMPVLIASAVVVGVYINYNLFLK